MPAEIADSDAESEDGSSPRPIASPITEPDVETRSLDPAEPDPVLDLQFSQFLSPTQRLSSFVPTPAEDSSRRTGSTDVFLREIAQEPKDLVSCINTSSNSSALKPTRTNVKRRFSDIENSKSDTIDDSHGLNSIKRAKTHGHTKTQKPDASLSLFSQDSGVWHGSAGSMPHALNSSQALASTNMDDVDEEVIEHNAAVDKEKIVLHDQDCVLSALPRANQQNASHLLDSMNGYRGITLDFRGEGGMSLDVNTNPFGSLSQVSLEGDINPTKVRKFASLFAESDTHPDNMSSREQPQLERHYTHPSNRRNTQGSPTEQQPRKDTDSVNTTAAQLPTGSHASPSGNFTNEHRVDDSVQHHSSSQVDGQLKKRGHTAKAHRSNAEVHENDGDTIHLPGITNPAIEEYDANNDADCSKEESANADTKDSSAIEISRGKKTKEGLAMEMSTTQSSPVKNISSDLGLNDPELVGAPKEIYHAKPSRSRSRKVDTFEKHFERELFAPHIDEDELLSTEVHIKANVGTTKSTKKSQRKAKVKRAKTSAAALLNKSEAWHDEGDDDVIWMEERPARISMELPPALDQVKEESREDKLDNQLELHSEQAEVNDQSRKDARKNCSTHKRISVDIPAPSKACNMLETGVAQPKKRGRKPKKKQEIHVDSAQDEDAKSIDAHDVTTEAQSPGAVIEKDASMVQPLSEIDPNLVTPSLRKTLNPANTEDTTVDDRPASIDQPVSKSPSKSPNVTSKTKPIHSPLKSTLATSSSPSLSSLFGLKPRLGLSRRTRIPSLLRKLDRSKEPPKIVERKEKLTKKQQEAEEKRRLEAEDGGEDGNGGGVGWDTRGADGMLVEWND